MAVNNNAQIHLHTPTAPELSAAEFAACMDQLNLPSWPRQMAVAVSGGADSMALALLANHWAKAQNIHITALTVDHGLRPEAAREAEQVATWLQARGMDVVVLRWNPPAIPHANVQSAARDARYSLMSGWCKETGASHLLLGHHLEDQAETFLIRLGRGSGVDGLSAMNAVTSLHDLTLLRPFLGVEKARLRATLHAHAQDWMEDPSNQNPLYTRVKLRNLLPVLKEAGLSAQRLADTAERMQRARSFLDQCETEAYARVVNSGMLERAAFCELHPEIGLRVLARIIRERTGDGYRPRFDELERLYLAIRQQETPLARTLSGLIFRSHPNGLITISHEKRA